MSVGEPANETAVNEREVPRALASWPLVPVAIALIVGIALQSRVPVRPGMWLIVAGVMLVGAMLSRKRPLGATALLLATTIFAGLALGQRAQYQYPPHHIAHFAGDERRLAELELRLDDAPRIVTANFGQRHPLPPKQTMLASVTAVRTWSGWASSTGEILVQIAEPNPQIAAGQRVRAIGMMDRPAPSMNPGQFDWATYYRQQRIVASFHIPHASSIEIIDRGRPSLLQRWRAWTREKLADGFRDRDGLDHALLRALVLGDSDPELRDVQEQFRATGTSHHLAISGMHVAVMGGVIFMLARLLRVRPRWAWAIAMTFVVAYGLAALPSAPVVRSILLWLAVGLAVLSRRSIDLVNLLALVVIAMLIYHPLDLFNAGFQLSFGTVLGLILLTKPISRMMRIGQPDPAERPMATHWLHRFAGHVDSQIVLILSAGIAAWLISMPIIATHFAQLNPWALFASIILAPFVFVSLIGGVVKILLTAAWPAQAAIWASMAKGPVSLMRWMVEKLAALPFGDVPLPAPPVWLLVMFFTSLLLLAFRWKRSSGRIFTAMAIATCLLVMLVLPFQSSITQKQGGGGVRVTLLAVGAGQCVVVEPPSGRTMLIDAGSMSLADPVRRCIAPFLRERGITTLDTIAISHANSDHFSAVAELVAAYGVREVLTAASFEKTVAANASAIELLQALRKQERPPRSLLPGQVIPLGSETMLEILWPPPDIEMLANDQSLVLRLTHRGSSILFTGDIEDAAMKALLADPSLIKSDVLIAPHHGSSEASTGRFIDAVSPRYILSSNDRSLTGKQTSFDLLVGQRPFYRTHTSGAVTIDIDASGKIDVTPHLSRPITNLP